MWTSESGDDFDEARSVFTEAFNLSASSFRPSESTFRYRHSVLGDSTMALQRNTLLARARSTAAPSSEIVISSTRGGVSFDGVGRKMVAIPLFTPYVMMNGYSTATVTGIDTDGDFVHIDKHFVHSVAQELPDSEFAFFPLTSTPATEHELRIWRRTVSLVTSVMVPEGNDLPALLRREMSRLVAIALLTCFPYRSAELPVSLTGSEPRSVRLAYEFIHINAHLPIGPVEIAEAAGLSIRALQYALRRHQDTTPTKLLRSIRLDRVHTALQTADPRLDSVSAIARQWGFLHLGRFSAAYRQRFGQLPSQTIDKYWS